MNKLIQGVLAGIALSAIVGFSYIKYDVRKSTGEVDQLQGYYIFVDSKPVMEYEYMGTVKGPSVSFGSGQYQSVRDVLIKRAKKDYPTADALIFTFKDGGTDRCDAIKFK